jgi:hypothetical protein
MLGILFFAFMVLVCVPRIPTEQLKRRVGTRE